MKKSIIFLALAAFATVGAIDTQEQKAEQFLKKRGGIKLNHWVLAKPNGHPITTLDLAKRLEVVFYQNYPDYASSQQARLQFYSQAWRELLNDQIDNQLMLLDAEEKHVKVADGDVRQELEQMFGPNVVATIDELGLTYTEAVEMIREDLTVQQMRGAMIHARASMAITPERLQETYEKFATNFTPVDRCKYQMLTIRHGNEATAREAAAVANRLAGEGLTLEEIYDKMDNERREGKLAGTLSIRVSELEERPVPSLATAYRDQLTEMTVGTTSGAIEQKSRSGDAVFRLFHLASWTEDELPLFDDVVDQIYSALLQNEVGDKQEIYLGKLRHQYGITEEYLATMIPDAFTPFTL